MIADFRKPLWTIVASVLWAAVLIVLLVRAGLHPERPTSLTTYLAGGSAWAAARPLYGNWRGFVYPPVIAWFFCLFTHIPLALASVLWRVITLGGFYSALVALMRSGIFHRIPPASRGLVFLGVLPLSIGNFDNAQANPLVTGLMMLAVAALQWEAWTLCAVAVGVATAFKIYPLVLALLLCLLRPRRLCWRIALVLILLALLPFAFQDSHYVSGQYQAWLQVRLADDRFQYPMKDAPLDLWYLLVRLGLLNVSVRAYTVFQIVTGAALAAFVWIQSRRGAALRDVLAALFLLVSVWILLLGPATENQTYVLLAPAACLVAVESLVTPNSCVTRLLANSAFGLLLAAVARNSLAPHLKSPAFMAVQPVAALLLLPAILGVNRGSRGSGASPTPPLPR